MKYYVDLFTPQTWTAFREHGGTVSGFSRRQRATAARLKPGDLFVCYLVRLSRWCGLLEVVSECYEDATPIFLDPDPFVMRFRVRPLVMLDFDRSVPIYEEEVWSRLSITRDIPVRSPGWAQTANLRASLRELSAEDGGLLRTLVNEQQHRQVHYPLSVDEQRKVRGRRSIPTGDRTVVVEIPDDENDNEDVDAPVASGEGETFRESHKIQALLATIGARMGFRIWIPTADKQRVLAHVDDATAKAFLKLLPLNYDENTLKTIEQIDVIWLRNRSMARAFEVEHTTAIYSGLLRMADLLALQPNMDIRLHIVAPEEKESKVLREIVRPVFSLLDRGPLYESCTYLTYDAVNEIARMKHLHHMSDTVLDDYSISAQEE